jgi:MFS family permease
MTTKALPLADQRAYEANLRKAYLYQFFMNFQLWWPIWVVYLQDKRGLSLTQITALDSVFWLVIVAAQVPAGAAADRWGRKSAMLLGSLFLSAGILVFGLADNYLLILVSYAAWGLGLAFQYGGDSAFLFDSLKVLGRPGEFQKVYGRYWGVASVGVIGGLLTGAPLAAATDLSLPILVSAGIALLAAAVTLTLKEPALSSLGPAAARSTVARGDSPRRELPADAPPVEARLSYGDLIRESFRLAYRQPRVRYVLLYGAVLGVASFVPIIFIQPFLRHHDVGVANLGLFQVPMRALAIVGALAAYRVTAVLGERQTMVLMPALLIVSYAVLGSWDAVYAYTAFPVVSLVVTMAYPVVADYLNRQIPSEQRATVLSIRQLLFSLLLAPIAPLLGFVADEVSLMGAFWASTLLVAVPLPFIFALWWRSEAREPSPEAAAIEAAPSQRISSG